jgi:aminomethyltransferase
VAYFGRRVTTIAGATVDVTRTGYTGDRGYELWIENDAALAVWDAVFGAGQSYGIHPAGIRALDVCRVEAGLILAEVEFFSARHVTSAEQKYSPFEVNLGRLVDFGKSSDFNGRAALLAEQRDGGPARRLVGLELEWAGIEGLFAKHDLAPAVSPMVHRDPVPVYKEGRQVGRATSIAWSPTLKKMIGFGSVDKRLERMGTRLSVEWSVEGERGKVAATVVPTPFLDLERKRT